MSESIRINEMDAGTVITAALVATAIGALFYNLLPLYLGTAQDYLGLDNRAIGFLSSAFFLGYNLLTISAFFWIRRLRWSTVVAVSVPVAAMGLYGGTLSDSYAFILLATAITGGAFSALYGVGTTILGDTSNPARWYGVKIAGEALPGAVLLLILPSTAIAKWGFDGIVIGLIVSMVLLSPFLFWIPRQGSKHQQASIENADPTAPQGTKQSLFIWLTLLATLVFFNGASAIWAFVERIGNQGGYDPTSVGTLLSVSLVFAVIGSLLAAVLGNRFGNVRPFRAACVTFILSLYPLHSPESFAVYAIGTCLLTFAIGLGLPFAVTEIAQLDTDGRFIVLSVPAIGIGAMFGPGIAGILAAAQDFFPVILFGGVSMVIATLLLSYAGKAARAEAEIKAPKETKD